MLLAFAFFSCGVHAFLLHSPLLDVVLDDFFPTPLTYSLASTNETLRGGLRRADFHTSISLNRGQVTCGESGMSTVYSSQPGSAESLFTVTAYCALAYGGGRGGGPPAWLQLFVNGSVSVAADPVGAGAAIFSLQ